MNEVSQDALSKRGCGGTLRKSGENGGGSEDEGSWLCDMGRYHKDLCRVRRPNCGLPAFMVADRTEYAMNGGHAHVMDPVEPGHAGECTNRYVTPTTTLACLRRSFVKYMFTKNAAYGPVT